jgi:oligoendopeptidase F
MSVKLSWDLNRLFKSEEEFAVEVNKINRDMEIIQKFKDIIFDKDLLLEVLNAKWSIKERANNVLIYASLRYYMDIVSEEAKVLKTTAEQLVADIDLKLGFINGKVIALGQDTINNFIKQKNDLQIYKLHLDNIFRLQGHVQDEQTNANIIESKNRINETLSMYNKLLHNLDYGEIVINDEKVSITSSNYAKYISSRDPEIRKNTYLVVGQSFIERANDFAEILNTIYKERVKITKSEQYQSVLAKELFEENIDPTILNILLEAVNNNLSIMHQYLRLKGKILNIDNPHLYDLGVPLDGSKMIEYSMSDAIEIVREALRPLGVQYMAIVAELLNNGYIDAEPNSNKHQTITFSWSTYSFMNFRGSYNDVKNMAHEIGHIVHAYLSKTKQPYIYEDSTVFIGEIAALVNEILLNKYLYENANTKEEKGYYLSKQIENFFIQVYKQTMYTEFENELYNIAAQNVELTTELLNSKYYDIINKYYGADIIYDDESKIEWTRLGHLYRWSYYVYKYSTGLLIASVIVNEILGTGRLNEQEYRNFLAAGSNDYPLNLLKKMGIDLTDKDVIDRGFCTLKSAVDSFVKTLEI